MRKKWLALAMAAVMTASLLAGCGGNGQNADTGSADAQPAAEENAVADAATDESAAGQEAAQKPEGLSDEVITVAIQAEPNSLVPDVVFVGNYVSTIERLIYEPLMIQNPQTLQFENTGLITAVEQVDDLHLAITLREGVMFQNGEEFGTDDVLYQFQQGVQGAFAGDYYSIWDVDNFEVTDDYHMTLALNTPWAQAQDILGFNTVMAVNKTVLEAAGGAGVTDQYLENAGTGKYVLKEWAPGEYIELARNENYWDQDNPGYFAGYKFVFVSDTSARAMAVQSGDADIALDCAISDYEVYNADPTVQAVLNELGNVSTLFLNSGKGGPLEDVRVREAVYWLIDKESLRTVANSGLGQIADTTISPLCAMWDGKTESEGKAVDVEKAKQLLAEAGYPDGLSLRMRTNGQVSAQLSMIQEQLRAGGIEVEIEVAETPVHFAALSEGDFDMYTSSQQCGYYSEAVRTTDGADYSFADVMGGCGYNDPVYSEICQRALTTYDEAERKAVYAELQDYFRENVISIGLYTGVGLTVARPDLQGFELFGVGVQDLSNLYSAGE